MIWPRRDPGSYEGVIIVFLVGVQKFESQPKVCFRTLVSLICLLPYDDDMGGFKKESHLKWTFHDYPLYDAHSLFLRLEDPEPHVYDLKSLSV